MAYATGRQFVFDPFCKVLPPGQPCAAESLALLGTWTQRLEISPIELRGTSYW
jgi:hypothetical protein